MKRKELVATTEAYDMQNDRLELHNLIKFKDKQSIAEVESLARIYRRALAHWRSEGGDYHGYAKFKTVFDRNENWPAKLKLYATRK